MYFPFRKRYPSCMCLCPVWKIRNSSSFKNVLRNFFSLLIIQNIGINLFCSQCVTPPGRPVSSSQQAFLGFHFPDNIVRVNIKPILIPVFTCHQSLGSAFHMVFLLGSSMGIPLPFVSFCFFFFLYFFLFSFRASSFISFCFPS